MSPERGELAQPLLSEAEKIKTRLLDIQSDVLEGRRVQEALLLNNIRAESGYAPYEDQ